MRNILIFRYTIIEGFFSKNDIILTKQFHRHLDLSKRYIFRCLLFLIYQNSMILSVLFQNFLFQHVDIICFHICSFPFLFSHRKNFCIMLFLIKYFDIIDFICKYLKSMHNTIKIPISSYPFIHASTFVYIHALSTNHSIRNIKTDD